MNKEKCFLIKDLLPSYIDELCGSETSEIIKEHLYECPECKKTYESMKGILPGEEENKNTVEYDNKLLEKVSRDVKKKSEKTKNAAIIAIASIIVLFVLLNLPIIPLGEKDLWGYIANPSFTMSEEWKKYNEIPERSIMLIDDDKKMEEGVFSKVIFDEEYSNKKALEDIEIYADIDYDLNKISVVEIESYKTIKAYGSEIQSSPSGSQFVVKGVRTSILGSFTHRYTSKISFLNYEEIDGVFLKKNGKLVSIR